MSSLPIKDAQTPLQVLRDHLGMIASMADRSKVPGLPRFSGGLVGYLGFETVRYFEPSLPLVPHPDLPEAIFLLADTVIAFRSRLRQVAADRQCPQRIRNSRCRGSPR